MPGEAYCETMGSVLSLHHSGNPNIEPSTLEIRTLADLCLPWSMTAPEFFKEAIPIFKEGNEVWNLSKHRSNAFLVGSWREATRSKVIKRVIDESNDWKIPCGTDDRSHI